MIRLAAVIVICIILAADHGNDWTMVHQGVDYVSQFFDRYF